MSYRAALMTILLGFSGLCAAEVTVNLDLEYVELRANNPKDLIEKLRIVKSPIMGDAYAWVHSNTQNDTTYTTTDTGCRLHSFDSELDITITLPRWVNVAERHEKHQQWWARLIEFITTHEFAHKKIIVEATEDFQKEAKTIGERSSCAEVKDAYRELKFKYANQIRQRDHRLDFKDGGRIKLKDFLFLDSLPDVKKTKKPANTDKK